MRKIRLTESQLNRVILRTAKRLMSESIEFGSHEYYLDRRYPDKSPMWFRKHEEQSKPLSPILKDVDKSGNFINTVSEPKLGKLLNSVKQEFIQQFCPQDIMPVAMDIINTIEQMNSLDEDPTLKSVYDAVKGGIDIHSKNKWAHFCKFTCKVFDSWGDIREDVVRNPKEYISQMDDPTPFL